jgi:hypothetical protein
VTEKSEDEDNGIRVLPIWALPLTSIGLVAVLFFVETEIWRAEISPLGHADLLFSVFVDLIEFIITAIFLSIGISRIVHERYKSALLPTLTAMVLIIIFILPGILGQIDERRNFEYHHGYPHDLAYHIEFASHEKQYLEEIKATQPDELGYRYKSFPWGGDRVVVYDESDALGSTAPALTYAWWWKVDGTEIDEEKKVRANEIYDGGCPYRVFRIKGHFYVIRFICG